MTDCETYQENIVDSLWAEEPGIALVLVRDPAGLRFRIVRAGNGAAPTWEMLAEATVARFRHWRIVRAVAVPGSSEERVLDLMRVANNMLARLETAEGDTVLVREARAALKACESE